jgi:IMP dehydrogenase
MSEFDIGRSKRAREAFSFDDISVVPSRRTRDGADVNLNWQIDAYSFAHPIVAAPMDSIASPEFLKTVNNRQTVKQKNIFVLFTAVLQAGCITVIDHYSVSTLEFGLIRQSESSIIILK